MKNHCLSRFLITLHVLALESSLIWYKFIDNYPSMSIGICMHIQYNLLTLSQIRESSYVYKLYSYMYKWRIVFAKTVSSQCCLVDVHWTVSTCNQHAT